MDKRSAFFFGEEEENEGGLLVQRSEWLSKMLDDFFASLALAVYILPAKVLRTRTS